MLEDFSEDHEALLEVITTCSFLTVREKFIFFVHRSAKEFLLEKARIDLFPRNKEAEHLAIFSRSLKTMFKTLRHNICGIELVESLTKEFTVTSPNPLAATKYACEYWVGHLEEGWCSEDNDHSLDDGGCVDSFLRQKFLHWLEGISILECLPEGIKAMLKLVDLLQVSSCSNWDNN
jgi:hypothetical protein